MIRKKKLPKKLKKELSGFEDVLDLMDGRNPLTSSSAEDKIDSKFDFINFFEIEEKRLEKIYFLFRDKIPIAHNYSHSDSVIKEQSKKLKKKKN